MIKLQQNGFAFTGMLPYWVPYSLLPLLMSAFSLSFFRCSALVMGLPAGAFQLAGWVTDHLSLGLGWW